MKAEHADHFESAIFDMIDHGVRQGFEFPLRLAGIAANGTLISIRFRLNEGKCEPEGMLADPSGGDMALPVNIMLCDRAGKCINATILTKGGKPTLRH